MCCRRRFVRHASTPCPSAGVRRGAVRCDADTQSPRFPAERAGGSTSGGRLARSKQMERAGEVLIVTGRGSGSVGQVPVVREEIRKLLNALRRAGVVEQFGEHNPGSFVVQMAPLRALFEAPRRERNAPPPQPSPPIVPPTCGTRSIDSRSLHDLAISLESLGLVAPAETLVVAEMERQLRYWCAGRRRRGFPMPGSRGDRARPRGVRGKGS